MRWRLQARQGHEVRKLEVGFGGNADARRGAELQSFPDGGGRRFAKTGLFIRGDVRIVLRVPRRLRDDVQMVGWGGRPRTRDTVKVVTTGAVVMWWTATSLSLNARSAASTDRSQSRLFAG